MKNGIVALSHDKVWDNAKKEWRLKEIYIKEYDTCLCGHYPIKEICVLHNHVNNTNAIVGNCCVKKFIDTMPDKIFTSVKRVIEDDTKNLNTATLQFATQHGWIRDKDINFYGSIYKKRSLSAKQQKWKVDINRKVIAKMKR